jgi:hypothetical protein
MIYAQTGIVGEVPVTYVNNGETDCNGFGLLVDVYADLGTLKGDHDEAAGLNAFILTWYLEKPFIFKSFRPGNQPDLNWSVQWTDLSSYPDDQVFDLKVIGYVADTQAPDGLYFLGQMLFMGDAAGGNFWIGNTDTDLGSRVALQSGPGPIPSTHHVGLLQLTLPPGIDFTLQEALSHWGTENDAYNFASGSTVVDVMDLIKLVFCLGNQ